MSLTVSSIDIVNGAITSAKIADGGITDTHIATSAAIAQSKIANLTASLASRAIITTTITGINSINGGGDLSTNRTLSLVNDSATPGNSKYYGTNSSGTRGYFDLPSGSAAADATTVSKGVVQLAAAKGYVDGQCLSYSSPYNYHESDTVNAALRTFLTPLPDTHDLTNSGTRGLWYQSFGTTNIITTISYYINGDQTCARGSKLLNGTKTRCMLYLN